MNAIASKLRGLKVSQIKEIIASLENDLSDDATLVYAAALGELEKRIPEAEFIAYCEAL